MCTVLSDPFEDKNSSFVLFVSLSYLVADRQREVRLTVCFLLYSVALDRIALLCETRVLLRLRIWQHRVRSFFQDLVPAVFVICTYSICVQSGGGRRCWRKIFWADRRGLQYGVRWYFSRLKGDSFNWLNPGQSWYWFRPLPPNDESKLRSEIHRAILLIR